MKIMTYRSPAYTTMSKTMCDSVAGDVIVYDVEGTADELWGTDGFHRLCNQKIEKVLEQLDKMEENEALLYVDSDCLLFDRPEWFVEQLENSEYDAIYQRQPDDTWNAGFFVLRNNERIKELLNEVLNIKGDYANDELALSSILNRIDNRLPVTVGFFEDENVSSPGQLHMKEGDPYDVPKELKAFHACHMVGIEAKAKLLEEVKQKYEQQT